MKAGARSAQRPGEGSGRARGFRRRFPEFVESADERVTRRYAGFRSYRLRRASSEFSRDAY